jgi:hypothetical protein
VSMRRSTRFRRLFVAFLVVITLAIVVRFARAAGSEGIAEAQDRAPSAPLSPPKQFQESHTFSFTTGLLR